MYSLDSYGQKESLFLGLEPQQVLEILNEYDIALTQKDVEIEKLEQLLFLSLQARLEQSAVYLDFVDRTLRKIPIDN